MVSLNITNILYLAFRLGPFVLVCYFILSSLFSQDFKSIIYLGGLILSCVVVILVSNAFPRQVDSPYICNQITLTGEAPMSSLPLSLTVYLFTFTYLITAMFLPAKSLTDSNLIAYNNITVLILFPLIILMDMVWILVYSCAGLSQVLLSFVLGAGLGSLWAYIISTSNMSSLLYMTVMSNAQVCQKPSKSRMKCRRVMTN